MTGVIIANTVALALHDPNRPTRLLEFERIELGFISVFLWEAVVRIIAQGFVMHENAYLRNPWNVFDLLITILSWVFFFLDIKSSISALRFMRVLTVIKTIPGMQGIKLLIDAMLRSLPNLSDVLALFTFILILFAVAAVQLWSGNLRRRCVSDTSGLLVDGVDDATGNPYRLCGPKGRTCPDGSSCVLGFDNPNMGVTNFDNVLWSFLTVFQIITLEGWTDILYWLQDGANTYAWIYFVILILLGSYFVLNLAVAVIFAQISRVIRNYEEERALKAKLSAANEELNTKINELDFALGVDDHDREITAKSLHRNTNNSRNRGGSGGDGTGGTVMRKTSSKTRKNDESEYEYVYEEVEYEEYEEEEHTGSDNSGSPGHGSPGDSDSDPRHRKSGSGKAASSPSKRAASRSEISIALRSLSDNARGKQPSASSGKAPGRRNHNEDDTSGLDDGGGTSKTDQYARRQSMRRGTMFADSLVGGPKGKTPGDGDSNSDPVSVPGNIADPTGDSGAMTTNNAAMMASAAAAASKQKNIPNRERSSLRRFANRVIQNRFFTIFIMLVIVVNTIILASVHYGQPQYWADFVFWTNMCFSAIFILEMILKLIGMGPKHYFRDRMNLFDCLIVSGSIVEFAFIATTSGTSSSGGNRWVSTFRAVRILRVFKLAKSWTSLNKLISVTLDSIGLLLNCGIILLIFMFVFAIMGMKIFGKKFEFPNNTPVVPRANFDTFGWSMVTVFHLVTGEAWNNVLYNGIAATTPASALYFIAIVVFGDYVILTMFQVVLLEKFSAATHQQQVDKMNEVGEKKLARDAMLKANPSASSADAAIQAATSGPSAVSGLVHSPSMASDLGSMDEEARIHRQEIMEKHARFRQVHYLVNTRKRAALDVGPKGKGKGKGKGQGWLNSFMENDTSDEEQANVRKRATARREIVMLKTVHHHSEDYTYSYAGSDSEGDNPKSNAAAKDKSTGKGKTANAYEDEDDHHDGSGPEFEAPSVFRAIFDTFVPSFDDDDDDDDDNSNHNNDNNAVGVKSTKAPPASDASVGSASASASDFTSWASSSSAASSQTTASSSSASSSSKSSSSSTNSAASKSSASNSEGTQFTDYSYAYADEEYHDDGGSKKSAKDVDKAESAAKLDRSKSIVSGDRGLAEIKKGMASPRGPPTSARLGSMRPSPSMQEDTNTAIDENANNPWRKISIKERKQRKMEGMSGRSLFLLSPTNPIRRFFANIVFSIYFELAIMMLIAFSSLLLALDGPNVAADSTLKKFIKRADLFFAAAFATEMALKVIVMGFAFVKKAYLRSTWNVLDMVVVIVSILAVTFLERIKWLRALRALRPLRVISRFSGMKIVVRSLTKSLPSIFNVVMVCFLFWIIFGILGVQFFGGKLSSCNDDTIVLRIDCVGAYLNESTSTMIDREWGPQRRSFDNIFSAMLVLFELASLENWPDIMYLGVDAVSDQHAPVRDHNKFASIYFIAFIMVGALFAVNLFVGVVIDYFTMMKEKETGHSLLTRSQRDWVELQRMMVRYRPVRKPLPPENSVRKFVFRICMHRYFEYMILIAIIINTIFLMSTHYNQPSELTRALEGINYFFVCLFTMEAVCKIIALGLGYFRDRWNVFDFVVVIISIVGTFVNIGFGGIVFRGLRVFRIFKIVRWAKGVNQLLLTLFYSIPTLSNVGSLLVLVFFVYAVSGVGLFGKVMRHNNITVFANFETFSRAMLTLFRCITGENWNELMHDFTLSPPYCDNSPAVDNCGSRIAYLYFLSFITIVYFVLVNLFIAVILESFNELTSGDRGGPDLNSETFAAFSKQWAMYDPHTTHYIRFEEIRALLRGLKPPLGVGPKGTEYQLARIILALDIPVYAGKVFYKDVLYALAHRTHGVEVPEIPTLKKVEKKWLKHSKEMKDISPEFTLSQFQAAQKIQMAWRQLMLRRKEKRAQHAQEREKIRQKQLALQKEKKAMERIQYQKSQRARAERLSNPSASFFDFASESDDSGQEKAVRQVATRSSNNKSASKGKGKGKDKKKSKKKSESEEESGLGFGMMKRSWSWLVGHSEEEEEEEEYGEEDDEYDNHSGNSGHNEDDDDDVSEPVKRTYTSGSNNRGRW